MEAPRRPRVSAPAAPCGSTGCTCAHCARQAAVATALEVVDGGERVVQVGLDAAYERLMASLRGAGCDAQKLHYILGGRTRVVSSKRSYDGWRRLVHARRAAPVLHIDAECAPARAEGPGACALPGDHELPLQPQQPPRRAGAAGARPKHTPPYPVQRHVRQPQPPRGVPRVTRDMIHDLNQVAPVGAVGDTAAAAAAPSSNSSSTTGGSDDDDDDDDDGDEGAQAVGAPTPDPAPPTNTASTAPMLVCMDLAAPSDYSMSFALSEATGAVESPAAGALAVPAHSRPRRLSGSAVDISAPPSGAVSEATSAAASPAGAALPATGGSAAPHGSAAQGAPSPATQPPTATASPAHATPHAAGVGVDLGRGQHVPPVGAVQAGIVQPEQQQPCGLPTSGTCTVKTCFTCRRNCDYMCLDVSDGALCNDKNALPIRLAGGARPTTADLPWKGGGEGVMHPALRDVNDWQSTYLAWREWMDANPRPRLLPGSAGPQDPPQQLPAAVHGTESSTPALAPQAPACHIGCPAAGTTESVAAAPAQRQLAFDIQAFGAASPVKDERDAPFVDARAVADADMVSGACGRDSERVVGTCGADRAVARPSGNGLEAVRQLQGRPADDSRAPAHAAPTPSTVLASPMGSDRWDDALDRLHGPGGRGMSHHTAFRNDAAPALTSDDAIYSFGAGSPVPMYDEGGFVRSTAPPAAGITRVCAAPAQGAASVDACRLGGVAGRDQADATDAVHRFGTGSPLWDPGTGHGPHAPLPRGVTCPPPVGASEHTRGTAARPRSPEAGAPADDALYCFSAGSPVVEGHSVAGAWRSSRADAHPHPQPPTPLAPAALDASASHLNTITGSSPYSTARGSPPRSASSVSPAVRTYSPGAPQGHSAPAGSSIPAVGTAAPAGPVPSAAAAQAVTAAAVSTPADIAIATSPPPPPGASPGVAADAMCSRAPPDLSNAAGSAPGWRRASDVTTPGTPASLGTSHASSSTATAAAAGTQPKTPRPPGTGHTPPTRSTGRARRTLSHVGHDATAAAAACGVGGPGGPGRGRAVEAAATPTPPPARSTGVARCLPGATRRSEGLPGGQDAAPALALASTLQHAAHPPGGKREPPASVAAPTVAGAGHSVTHAAAAAATTADAADAQGDHAAIRAARHEYLRLVQDRGALKEEMRVLAEMCLEPGGATPRGDPPALTEATTTTPTRCLQYAPAEGTDAHGDGATRGAAEGFAMNVLVEHTLRLTNADLLNSDLYVRLETGDGEVLDTKTKYMTVRPSWREVFRVASRVLRVQVRSRGFRARQHDTVLGEGSALLSPQADGEVRVVHVELEDCGRCVGALCLRTYPPGIALPDVLPSPAVADDQRSFQRAVAPLFSQMPGATGRDIALMAR